MQLDSKEEMYIVWWLQELKDQSLIEDFERSKEFVLSPKRSIVEGKIIREHSYTPDFDINWSVNGGDLFVGYKGSPFTYSDPYKSIIEVKPQYDSNNMTRLFRINQKWVMDKYNIYVDLIQPESLFKKTFCPDRFRYTDGGKGLRKLKEEYLTLNEYITNREGIQKSRKR